MNNHVILSVVSLVTSLLSTHTRVVQELNPSTIDFFSTEPNTASVPPLSHEEEILLTYNESLTLPIDYATVTDQDQFRNYISGIEFTSMANDLIESTKNPLESDLATPWIPLTPEGLASLTSSKISEMDKYYDDIQEIMANRIDISTNIDSIPSVNDAIPSYGYFDLWMLSPTPFLGPLHLNEKSPFQLKFLSREFQEALNVIGKY